MILDSMIAELARIVPDRIYTTIYTQMLGLYT